MFEDPFWLVSENKEIFFSGVYQHHIIHFDVIHQALLNVKKTIVQLYQTICLKREHSNEKENITISQVEDSGDQIPKEPAGKRRKNNGSCRNILEVTGTWKQYSSRKISRFSPVISDQFLVESIGK